MTQARSLAERAVRRDGMRTLCVVLALVVWLIACACETQSTRRVASYEGNSIWQYDDVDAGVRCYIAYAEGISCLKVSP